MIAVVAFTRRGCQLGQRLALLLAGQLYTPERLAEEYSAIPYGNLQAWTEAQFLQKNDLIFVSATGIAVRSIAPHVRDKLTDPAVLSVDELGHFVVPLLSGHVGGANALALRVADLIGGQAVISTATDLNGVFAVDLWACANNLMIVDKPSVKTISSALLADKQIYFTSDFPWNGELPAGVLPGDCLPHIRVTDQPLPICEGVLQLVPRNLVLGLGCKRGTTQQQLLSAIEAVFHAYKLDLRRVCRVGSIDLKQNEEGLLSLCHAQHWPLTFFSADTLRSAPGSFTPSDFVQQITGVDNVCERAAICLGGTLLISKQPYNGVTVAVATLPVELHF